MKILLLLLLLPFASLGQNLPLLHTQWIGGNDLSSPTATISHNTAVRAAINYNDSFFLFVGYSSVHNNADIPANPSLDTMLLPDGRYASELLLGAIDRDNNLLWVRTYGGKYHEFGAKLIKTRDGGVAILGISCSSNQVDVWETNKGYYPQIPTTGYGYGEDIWLLKLDASFNVQWSKLYGNEYSNLNPGALIECSNGDFLFSSTESYAGGDIPFVYVPGTFGSGADWVLFRTDSLGNKRWSKTMGGTSIEADRIGLHEINGLYFFVSNSLSCDYDCAGAPAWACGNNSSIRLIVMDDTGHIIRKYVYGGSQSAFFYGSILNKKKEIVCIGQTESRDHDVPLDTPLSNNPRTWVFSIDSLGTVLWSKLYGDHASEFRGFDIKETQAGGYFCTWQTDSPKPPWQGIKNSDGWALLLDSSGNALGQKIFGSIKNDIPFCVATIGNNYFSLGDADTVFTEGTNSPKPDRSYCVFSSKFNFWSAGIKDMASTARAKLFSIAPNPASKSVQLTWTTEARRTELVLMDATGKQVKRWQQGANPVQLLDISGIPAGVYTLLARQNKPSLQQLEKLIIQ